MAYRFGQHHFRMCHFSTPCIPICNLKSREVADLKQGVGALVAAAAQQPR
jgi:hypothetical protein